MEVRGKDTFVEREQHEQSQSQGRAASGAPGQQMVIEHDRAQA